MFEKEEKELLNIKERYEHVTIPSDKIDQAIFNGFKKGKLETTWNKKFKRKIWIWPSIVAAILIIGLLTSIRVSPTFASYLKKVPGMERIVELVRFDKGLLAAVENDYVQEIGVSQEKNGTKFTIDSVISDEQGIMIFYTIEMKKKQHKFKIDSVMLQPKSGDKLEEYSLSFGRPADEGIKTYSDTIEYFFSKPIEPHQDYRLNIKVKSKEISEQFSIPFTIKKQEKTNQIYDLNQTVSIQSQKIMIKKVTIYPLRVAVHVVMDPKNTKKILEFQDIRLVDESGEVWSKIANGTTSSKISDDESIVYLQSNYFKKPKKLYLVFNEIQAVDKDQANILVDTEKKQILKQPSGNALTNIKIEGSTLSFALNTKKEFNYFMFSTAVDAEGKEHYLNPEMSGYDGHKRNVMLRLPSEKYKNPIKIKLDYYPSWIEGEVKIRVK